MPSIKITQEIKDKNDRYNYTWLSNAVVDDIVLRGLPNKFFVTEPISGGYQTRTDLHEADGWQTPVVPNGYNPETQILGVIVDIDGIHTYALIDLTTEEIQQRIISESESKKQDLIQQKLEDDVVSQAQTVTDEEALNQIDLYPFWSGDSVSYTLDFKVLDFTADNELALYKVVQAHTSQPNWNPISVPALFTRVQLGDTILDWVQPTGAQDDYQIGDQVYHDNPNDGGTIWLYESNINANTQEPGRDGTFDRWWQPIQPR